MTRRLSAGDTIEARCTRCRKILNHTIVAMVGERVVRVECNTCRGTHNYHGEKAPATPATAGTVKTSVPKPRADRKDPGAADRIEWESLLPAMERGPALPYDIGGKYKLNAVLTHPVFGPGIVKTVRPNKIEVLFRDGKKLLRCG